MPGKNIANEAWLSETRAAWWARAAWARILRSAPGSNIEALRADDKPRIQRRLPKKGGHQNTAKHWTSGMHELALPAVAAGRPLVK